MTPLCEHPASAEDPSDATGRHHSRLAMMVRCVWRLSTPHQQQQQPQQQHALPDAVQSAGDRQQMPASGHRRTVTISREAFDRGGGWRDPSRPG